MKHKVKNTPASTRKQSKPVDFASIIDEWLPGVADVTGKSGRVEPTHSNSQNIRKLPVQDRLDLHGLTLEQARITVDRFLKQAASLGLRKVIIIHGKGLHSSSSEGILRIGIQKYLEGHPLAGRRENAGRQEGGSGATVVYLRQRISGNDTQS